MYVVYPQTRLLIRLRPKKSALEEDPRYKKVTALRLETIGSFKRLQNIFIEANHGSQMDFKTPFFQDIKNSFFGVTQMGLKPHQNFFQIFFQQIWLLEEFKVFAY